MHLLSILACFDLAQRKIDLFGDFEGALAAVGADAVFALEAQPTTVPADVTGTRMLNHHCHTLGSSALAGLGKERQHLSLSHVAVGQEMNLKGMALGLGN